MNLFRQYLIILIKKKFISLFFVPEDTAMDNNIVQWYF